MSGNDNCDAWGNCLKREMTNMRYPMATPSLYKNRFYDNQTAKSRCYERNPIDIVEGFGAMSLNNLLMWVVIILVVYLLYKTFMVEEVPLEMNTIFSPVSELK